MPLSPLIDRLAAIAVGIASLLLVGWITVLICSLIDLTGTPAQILLTSALLISCWSFSRIEAKIPTHLNLSSEVPQKIHSFITLIALTLAIAAIGLRFYNLSWSELQGDEARVMLFTERLVSGDPSVLFEHRKGPGEILTAAIPSILFPSTVLQNDHELLLRLPFAIAGTGAIVLLCACAFQFGGMLSALTILLLALSDGILFGFSRIIQYQMPMLLFGVAGWYLLLTQNTQRVRPYLFLAASALCHYDGIFFIIPAFLYLYALRTQHNESWRALLTGALIVILPLIAFYVPFRLSDSFHDTAQYLAARAGSIPLPTNNIPRWLNTWEIYSGPAAAFSLLLVISFAGYYALGRFRATVAFSLLVCIGLLLPRSEGWVASILACSAFFLIGAAAQRAARLWAGAIAIVYLPLGFWFAHPNTHFLAATPALLLGCSWALTYVPTSIRRALLIVQITIFPLILWQHHQRFTRESFTRANTRRSVVEFGFAHQTGLRLGANALRALVADRAKTSVWVNDDPLVAGWYLRDFRYTQSSAIHAARLKPDFIIQLAQPRELQRPPFDIGRSYQAVTRIRYAQGRKLADVAQRTQPVRY